MDGLGSVCSYSYSSGGDGATEAQAIAGDWGGGVHPIEWVIESWACGSSHVRLADVFGALNCLCLRARVNVWPTPFPFSRVSFFFGDDAGAFVVQSDDVMPCRLVARPEVVSPEVIL